MGSKAHHVPNPNASLIRIENSGKKITFPPRAFTIVWGNDNRYWRLPAADEHNNTKHKKEIESSPAELIQVCWLEVTGVTAVTKAKKYKVSFDLALKSDAFGWNGCKVYIMAKIGKKGKYTWKKITLSQQEQPNTRLSYPPEDDKLEIQVTEEEGDPDLYFGLYEVWSGKWKGGLQIYNATITQL